MATKWGYDETNGIIIGGEYKKACLFNEDRQQGPSFYGDTDEDLIKQATAYTSKLKTDLGEEYKRLYPNGFELRIYD